MPDHPAVSVIMNCLNCAQYLKEALDSVFAQTFEDWEIVFWDNASSDASGAIAQEYGEKVRSFRGEFTVPLGQARNLAIQQAKGQYIAFLDCDDLWMPSKLEQQVKLFEQDPEVGLVLCDTIFFQDGQEHKSLYHKHKPPRGYIFRHLLTNYCLSMETAVIRKSALDSLGEWFDDRLNVSEEADLFLRLCYRHKADYVDEPLAKWRINPNSWTHQHFHLFAEEKEMILGKLEKTIPAFSQDYAEEIEVIKRQTIFKKAITAWQHQDPEGARKLLRPYLSNKKCLALYAATFFPRRTFNWVWNLYLRYRYLLS